MVHVVVHHVVGEVAGSEAGKHRPRERQAEDEHDDAEGEEQDRRTQEERHDQPQRVARVIVMHAMDQEVQALAVKAWGQSS